MESVQGADCTREHIGLQPPEAAAPVEANSKTQENGLQRCKHDDLLMGVVEFDRNTEVITDALAAYPAKAEIVQIRPQGKYFFYFKLDQKSAELR